jgi:hypothetical protein
MQRLGGPATESAGRASPMREMQVLHSFSDGGRLNQYRSR